MNNTHEMMWGGLIDFGLYSVCGLLLLMFGFRGDMVKAEGSPDCLSLFSDQHGNPASIAAGWHDDYCLAMRIVQRLIQSLRHLLSGP